MEDVIITKREPLKVVGMEIRTTVRENKIPLLWEAFIARMDELGEVAVPDCSLGICSYDRAEEYDEDTEFTYMVCKVVKDDSVVPEGMVYREIPETLVAVFTHKGLLDTLGDTYQYIYDEWLVESDFELAEGDEIEWYDSRFKFDDSESQMDIHIPIKRQEL